MQKMPQFIYAYVYAIVYVYGMYSPLPAVYGTAWKSDKKEKGE